MDYRKYMESYELPNEAQPWLGKDGKKETRLRIDNYKCRICGSKENLNVHHLPESYDKIPYESVASDLITLCRRHHLLVHEDMNKQKYSKIPITVEPHQSHHITILEIKNEQHIKVPAHRNLSHHSSQRTIIRPDEPIC